MLGKRVIVTNNPKAYERYNNKVEVYFDQDDTAEAILSKALELVKGGARMTNPHIKNPLSHYRTVGLFYGDANAPLKRNVDELENAMEEIRKHGTRKSSFFSMAQMQDVNRCGVSK